MLAVDAHDYADRADAQSSSPRQLTGGRWGVVHVERPGALKDPGEPAGNGLLSPSNARQARALTRAAHLIGSGRGFSGSWRGTLIAKSRWGPVCLRYAPAHVADRAPTPHVRDGGRTSSEDVSPVAPLSWRLWVSVARRESLRPLSTDQQSASLTYTIFAKGHAARHSRRACGPERVANHYGVDVLWRSSIWRYSYSDWLSGGGRT